MAVPQRSAAQVSVPVCCGHFALLLGLGSWPAEPSDRTTAAGAATAAGAETAGVGAETAAVGAETAGVDAETPGVGAGTGDDTAVGKPWHRGPEMPHVGEE